MGRPKVDKPTKAKRRDDYDIKVEIAQAKYDAVAPPKTGKRAGKR